MEIRTIGILGAGSMGRGIAQLAAQSGFQVVLSDTDLDIVEKAVASVEQQLARLVDKGKLSDEDRKNTLGRIRKAAGVKPLAETDFVIEAVFEDEQLKKDIFQELDQICRPEVLLTTNTSTISITSIASATKRPDKVAGMHFFNPAPVMRLVEVIRGYYTSDDTVRTVMDLARRMGKTPVEVKKDSPGFLVNRIMLAQFCEAMKLLEEGVATVEDIDTAVKLGLNYPMGPFELMDFTGVDIALHTLNYLCNEFKETRWNPPFSLKRVVKAGRYGRKTGRGWYDYSDK
ncbi:MAG: 3-hydroxyacyl-CoA dehydrogenase family protein [Clostridia bacterium]|jgi:3-hydroxybutyryl-CoA dehydrogenase|nr:3-hydroxyacyl-CoA dehydrogenase family protein [Clostridia bacterium]MDH7573081.1 3-hydroxyacyl-CoA dehydrogenase family protein [Clostridia bacterium]